MGTLRHYGPKDHDIIVGVAKISGYAEDTHISVEQTEDGFSIVVGADGETTRVRNHNRTHRVTITLMQNSPSNDVLAALHLADVNTEGGAGVVPFMFRNRNGTTLMATDQAWVVKNPNLDRAKSVGPVTWLIDLVDPAVLVGT